MATREEISNIGFEIVAYAGDAETDLTHALEAARTGDFEKARELSVSANQSLIEAHNVQTSLLSQEAGGAVMEPTFIMVHAQDTLMTTMMLQREIKFFIDEYERIQAVEKRLDAAGL